jgi:outer membrane protein
MKRAWTTVVVIGWLVSAGGGSAAEPASEVPVFTLRECIALGLTQAASARNAYRDELIAGTLIEQARAEILPHLNANGNYTRLDDVSSFEFDGNVVEMGLEDNYEAGVELTQLLYSGGSVKSSLRAAELYRKVAQSRVQQILSELIRDIRMGFNDILLADERVRVRAASVSQLEELLAQAESRYRQQTVSEYEVLSARVRVANDRPLLIAARKEARLARATFRNQVQLEPEEFELDGALVFEPSDRPLEDWEILGLERRPELQEQRDFLGIWEAGIRAEQGGYFPQIRAFAGYQGQNPESGSAREAWEWGWNAGVRAEWDLFDGALRRNKIKEKQLELDKSKETLADTERQIVLEIQSHYLDLQQAAETVAASRETVSLAEKGLEIALARYENGLATNLDYADANLALSRARLTRLLALHEHMNALARLEQASAEPVLTGEQP